MHRNLYTNALLLKSVLFIGDTLGTAVLTGQQLANVITRPLYFTGKLSASLNCLRYDWWSDCMKSRAKRQLLTVSLVTNVYLL